MSRWSSTLPGLLLASLAAMLVLPVRAGASAAPADAARWIRRAEADRRRPAARRVALERAVAAAPTHVAAVAPFARLLSSEGAHVEASRLVAAIVPVDEADRRATRTLRVEVALAAGRVEDAAAALDETDATRADLPILRNVAESAAAAGAWAACARVLARAAAVDSDGTRRPTDWQPARDLAYVRLALGQPREAAALLESLRREDRPDPDLDRDLAGALLAAGEARRAADLYRALAAAQPSSTLWLDLALAERATGNVEAAIAAARRAVDAAPNDPVPHAALGELLGARGDQAGAATAFRRALALRPDWPRAVSGLRALGM
ncbi:MAG: tetratricopeptide repeat protein [Deltaproteobacteria bacterium]|nr:tetratricopeptide repeat protein [Deltaproteobacteria bacterium]